MQWPFGRRARLARAAAAWHVEMEEPTSAAQVAEFEAWLRADPAHLLAYREAGAIGALGERLDPVSSFAPPYARPQGLKVLAALAALVIVVSGSWLAIQERSPAFTAIVNRSPAVRTFVLSDGTRVVLDAGAAIATPAHSAPDVIQLTAGRVRLAVHRPSGRPLRIETAAGPVLAADCILDLAARDTDVRLRVLRGNASLAAGSTAKSLPVRAGTALRINAGTVTPDPAMPDVAWPNARVAFEQTSLARVIARANRTGSPKLQAADAVGATTLTGVLDLRDNRRLAPKLAAALDLRIDDRGETILLHR